MDKFFDSLYTRFILRDFLGKIVPGAALILALAAQFSSWTAVVAFLNKLNTGAWIVGLGVAWIVGLAIQSLGETLGLFIYWPRKVSDSVERMVKFDQRASDGMRHQVERLRVMKETCGTAAIVALLVCAAAIAEMVFVAIWLDQTWLAALRRALPTLAASLPLFALLQRMHREHVMRQDKVMGEVIRNPQAAK
jgi:hypothetical protein